MTVRVPSLAERNLRVILDIIRQMQRGRSNANGTFTLATSPATSTSVTDDNCQANSHVSVTPKTANARATAIYVVPAAGSFTAYHSATASTDCTYSYAIVG